MTTYKCPDCGSESELYAAAYITNSIDINLSTEEPRFPEEHHSDPEWDEDSSAWCERCQWQGRVSSAEVEEKEEAE